MLFRSGSGTNALPLSNNITAGWSNAVRTASNVVFGLIPSTNVISTALLQWQTLGGTNAMFNTNWPLGGSLVFNQSTKTLSDNTNVLNANQIAWGGHSTNDYVPVVQLSFTNLNITFTTNAATTTVACTNGGILVVTTGTTFAGLANLPAVGQEAVFILNVTNSSGSLATLTPVASWRTLGTWNITNESTLYFDVIQNMHTNVICVPWR